MMVEKEDLGLAFDVQCFFIFLPTPPYANLFFRKADPSTLLRAVLATPQFIGADFYRRWCSKCSPASIDANLTRIYEEFQLNKN